MSKKKSAQKKLINELKNQLVVQAERLGIKEQYTPLYFEETKLDSVSKILSEFYMERANLEYELQTIDSNKREVMIKLERLNAYVRKAVSLRQRHVKEYENILEKATGDQVKTRRAVRQITPAHVQAAA
ncbi:hypothetical protein HZB07_01885 [Candidatus Saganbacteria bacterium]|nr:hypothetical protein [Candidatus Saganbacteria bacterium]